MSENKRCVTYVRINGKLMRMGESYQVTDEEMAGIRAFECTYLSSNGAGVIFIGGQNETEVRQALEDVLANIRRDISLAYINHTDGIKAALQFRLSGELLDLKIREVPVASRFASNKLN